MRRLEAGTSIPAWLAAYDEGGLPSSAPSRWGRERASVADALAHPSPRRLELLADPATWSPSLAESGGCRIIFDGYLDNRSELVDRLAARLPRDPGDGDVVAHAYHLWGEDAIRYLKGVFAVVIADGARDRLLCARDPFGLHPLFYAEVGRTILFSPSVESLLGHPGVTSEINRARLVDHLLKRWLVRDETYFTQVRRVLPGHFMMISAEGRRMHRYWNPVPADRPIAWIPDHEAHERFETLLEQAVARCLVLGPAGIHISGGLDSSALAMVASEFCRREGRTAPWALSIAFLGLDRDETAVQRGVTAALGMEQVTLSHDEAAGPEGTLAAALEMSRTMPAPLSMIWAPALRRLASEGKERGCRVILTGDGADEWLGESPLLVADYLRSLDLLSIYRLCRTYIRSYHFSRSDAVEMLLWRCGARLLLRDAGQIAAAAVGADALVPKRWRFPATMAIDSPPWLAPDPTLAAEVAQRLEAFRASTKALPRAPSYYLQDILSRLDATEKWVRAEETFLIGQRIGVRLRQPFWDVDIVDLMVRVRPGVRNEAGLSKALVRGPLVRRLPHLGFESQRKTNLGSAFLAVVAAQAGAARLALGDTRALDDLGVVDRKAVSDFLDNALTGNGPPSWLGSTWEILNLEAWAQAHC